jgi:type II secretory pathway component PulK
MVNDRRGERGVALILALATLTVVAITVAAVASELRARSASVTVEERSVRTAALCDAAIAETLAKLAERGSTFQGISRRRFAGGLIESRVLPLGEWEVEVVAVGQRNDWQMTSHLRVLIHGAPRVVWWQRTQGPVGEE